MTGAGGEIGHGLIARLAALPRPVVTIDIAPLDRGSSVWCFASSPVRSPTAVFSRRVLAQFEIDLVFHLAALLSTRSEFTPVTAHQVNVDGTLNLLEFAQHEGESHGRPVMFVYPSSIARLRRCPTSRPNERAPGVREDEWNLPQTMYGCNKLYCEHLGRYYARALQAAGGRACGAGRFPMPAVSRI